MEPNDVKKQLQNVLAPATGRPILGGEAHDLDNLVAAMRAVDLQDRRTLWLSMTFLLAVGVFCALLFGLTGIAPPDDSPSLHRVVLLTFALVFLSIGLLLRRKSRGLNRVDYSEPVLTFLAAAERRCRFVRPEDFLFAIPFLVLLGITCSAAVMLAMKRYLPAWDPAWGLAACCILFPLSAATGYWFGLLNWRKKRQPLLQQIQRMQIALGAAETLLDSED